MPDNKFKDDNFIIAPEGRNDDKVSDDNFIIAVAQNNDGELASIPDTEKIMFFHKGDNGWVIDQTIVFNFEGSTGLCQMRARLFEMVKELAGVKAMVAKGYPGISMEVLSRAGFTLYELDGFQEELLSEIEDHSQEMDKEEETVPTAPFETDEGSGNYFLDLRTTLNTYPELTTKKVLRPFFERTKFASLSVIYDHLPPWLPPELKQRNLDWDSENIPGGVRINIIAENQKPCQ